IDDRPERLAHPLAVEGQEAVAEDLARQRQVSAHQHRRPDDRVKARDVLADDMEIGGPPFLEELLVAAETHRGRVVDQRVEPDVRVARRVERQRNAPGLPRPADGDVDETAFDEPQNLVSTDVGLQELGMRLEMIQEPLLVLREPEEVVLLADPLGRQRRMERTLAIDEVLLLLELLAADAVPALVDALVDLSLVVEPASKLRDARTMARLRRPDEVVEGDVELPPGAPELLFHPVAVGDRIEPLFGGL